MKYPSGPLLKRFFKGNQKINTVYILLSVNVSQDDSRKLNEGNDERSKEYSSHVISDQSPNSSENKNIYYYLSQPNNQITLNKLWVVTLQLYIQSRARIPSAADIVFSTVGPHNKLCPLSNCLT